jgi:hypothetical protein
MNEREMRNWKTSEWKAGHKQVVWGWKIQAILSC